MACQQHGDDREDRPGGITFHIGAFSVLGALSPSGVLQPLLLGFRVFGPRSAAPLSNL